MYLFGFGHQKRVGKDTACDILVKELGFVKLSFAYPLKQIRDLLTNGQPTGFGYEQRELLQKLGTDIFRDQFHKDVWAIIGARNIQRHVEAGFTRLCFSDVRFQNEFDVIKELGGRLIKVHRPGQHIDSHASEHGIDQDTRWDYYLANDVGLAEYRQNVLHTVLGFMQMEHNG